jgi:hypothetical protein
MPENSCFMQGYHIQNSGCKSNYNLVNEYWASKSRIREIALKPPQITILYKPKRKICGRSI